MNEKEQELGLMMDKLLNDGTYGIQTHFNAMDERIDGLERKLALQTKLFKELWGKMKALEQK